MNTRPPRHANFTLPRHAVLKMRDADDAPMLIRGPTRRGRKQSAFTMFAPATPVQRLSPRRRGERRCLAMWPPEVEDARSSRPLIEAAADGTMPPAYRCAERVAITRRRQQRDARAGVWFSSYHAARFTNIDILLSRENAQRYYTANIDGGGDVGLRIGEEECPEPSREDTARACPLRYSAFPSPALSSNGAPLRHCCCFDAGVNRTPRHIYVVACRHVHFHVCKTPPIRPLLPRRATLPHAF